MKRSALNISYIDLASHFLVIFWPPFFVFTVHIFVSRILHGYEIIPWIDIPMHFLGGLSMAFSFSRLLAYLQKNLLIEPIEKFIELILTMTLVITVAVLWEFCEFSIDQVLGTNIQINLANTMQDLFMGMLGAGSMIGMNIIRNLKRM